MTSSMEIVDATAALEYWRTFDLTSKRVSLDTSVEEMRAAKTASISGRKRLNEITKTFRSKTKEEQAETVTEILKAYQEEIDQLSRRSKLSELSFYNLYKGIYEAPDPAAAIDGLISTVSSGSTNALEMEKLKTELAQYDEEFQKLKNQDVTIRRLEEELSLFKNNAEDKVEDIVASKLNEAEGMMNDKIAEALESQRATERRLQASMEAMKLAQEHAERAQTELFDVNSQAESRISALMSENSILVESNQRSISRVGELEGDLENARRDLRDMTCNNNASASASEEGAADSGIVIGVSPSSKLQSDLVDKAALQAKISELHAELRNAEETARVSKSFLEKGVNELTSQLAQKKEALRQTKEELSNRPTKAELVSLKRQLRTLQRVAFNVADDDASDEDEESEGTGGDAALAGQAEIDTMVLTRLKALETELLDTKNRLVEVSKAEVQARSQVEAMKGRLESSEALITRLESDLMLSSGGDGGSSNNVNNDNNNRSSRGSSAGNMDHSGDAATAPYGTVSKNNNATSNKIAGELALSELLGVDAVSIPEVKVKSGGALNQARQAAESSSQMVQILQGQRDRYKERLSACETNVATLQSKVGLAEAKAKQMEQDNLQLYGKLRYLQSLNGGGGAGVSSTTSSHISPQAMRISHTRGSGAGDSFDNNTTTWGRLGLGLSSNNNNINSSTEDVDVERGHSGAFSGQYGSAEGLDGLDAEGKYRLLYERNLNPFSQFGRDERNGSSGDLSVGDHIIFSTLQQFTATSSRRNALLAYFGVMHVLVMLCFYWMTHHAAHIHGCDPGIDHLTHKTLMLQKLES